MIETTQILNEPYGFVIVEIFQKSQQSGSVVVVKVRQNKCLYQHYLHVMWTV